MTNMWIPMNRGMSEARIKIFPTLAFILYLSHMLIEVFSVPAALQKNKWVNQWVITENRNWYSLQNGEWFFGVLFGSLHLACCLCKGWRASWINWTSRRRASLISWKKRLNLGDKLALFSWEREFFFLLTVLTCCFLWTWSECLIVTVSERSPWVPQCSPASSVNIW